MTKIYLYAGLAFVAFLIIKSAGASGGSGGAALGMKPGQDQSWE